MRSPRPRTLFLPVLGLLAAAMVMLLVVTVTTYFNLEKAREQAERVLEAQASAVVSGLAAGLRTGWRHWVWERDSLQGLVQEMSQTGDVEFIALLDKDGLVIAHSDPDLVGRVLVNYPALASKLSPEQIRGWFGPKGTYLSGRLIPPPDLSKLIPPPGLEEMGPGMMGSGKMRQRLLEHLERDNKLKPDVILVGLKTDTFMVARRQQLMHALIMASLLFVLGSAAIYFIFMVQNYQTIDKTLRNLSTYTSNIVDNMPNGLISTNAHGEPVVVNRAAREMFGWGEKKEKALTREPALESLRRKFEPMLAGGSVVLEEEFEAPGGSGQLPLAVSAAMVPAGAVGDETGPGTVFILRDLRQIRALEEQVRQSEKLAAVGQLAAGVAHEVRNPLSSMRGLARFLARDLDEKSRESEYLKVMVEEIDRLDRVITGLLDFARPRQPELEMVDLNETAQHTLNLVTDDARAQGISIRSDMSRLSPSALADRDMAVQAMLNIMLNAIEAMPEGGRMTVMTQVAGHEAVFAVEDTGPGIAPEDRNKLIDPFYTTKKKGSGLGLAQVAGIMKAHQGRLELGGEPGMGARVALYFPLAEETRKETA